MHDLLIQRLLPSRWETGGNFEQFSKPDRIDFSFPLEQKLECLNFLNNLVVKSP